MTYYCTETSASSITETWLKHFLVYVNRTEKQLVNSFF